MSLLSNQEKNLVQESCTNGFNNKICNFQKFILTNLVGYSFHVYLTSCKGKLKSRYNLISLEIFRIKKSWAQ